MLGFIESEGYTLKQHDNIWVSSDDAAVQLIIDAFDPLPDAQAEAVEAISQHADNLIAKKINPIKQRRLQADAVSATIQKGNGTPNAPQQAKLDNYEAAMAYPNAIFAQYDIEEAAILAQTDWTLIDIEAAKASLDNIV